MNVCTIVARNYLAYARVLAASFARHHSGEGHCFTVLVVDDRQAEVGNEPFSVMRPEDLQLDADEFRHMAAIYDVMELSTALKPFLLKTLLAQGSDHAVYLDPDIQIFGSLEPIAAMVRKHGIVLTPHTTEPMPRDGYIPSEEDILLAGVYNLGFVAVGKEANAFLEWWSERLLRDCISDQMAGHFVDQKWVEFVPSYWDHYVLRNTEYNVAYWNLATRKVSGPPEAPLVDGRQLRFFHFSGYDVNVPDRLSKYQGATPRIRLDEEPSLAALCAQYGAALLNAGHADCSDIAYGWSALPGGLVMDRRMRRAYRSALLAADRGQGAIPPDPFDAQSALPFVAWLKSDVSADLPVSRYLYEVWAESELLRSQFDLTRNAGDFLRWVRRHGWRSARIPLDFVAGVSTDAAKSNVLRSFGRRAAESKPAELIVRLARRVVARDLARLESELRDEAKRLAETEARLNTQIAALRQNEKAPEEAKTPV